MVEAVIGSRLPRREPGADDVAGGVILGIADDRHSAAVFADHVGFGNAFGGVVGSLGLDVGTNFANKRAHIPFGKDDYGIDIPQRGKNLGAFSGRHQGATFTLERADGIVGVDGNNETATQFLRGVEV